MLQMALIVVTGTLAFYLYYQSHIQKTMIDAFRPQAQQMINTYAQINRANIDTFAAQITAYAVTHPDFQPILKKYGWVPPSTKPTNTALPPKK